MNIVYFTKKYLTEKSVPSYEQTQAQRKVTKGKDNLQQNAFERLRFPNLTQRIPRDKSFFTKIEDNLNMIMSAVTWRTTSIDKSIPRNIVGSVADFFVRIFSSLRSYRCWSYFLIKTQDYSLQPGSHINFVTDDFMKLPWSSCSESFRNIKKNVCRIVHFYFPLLLIQLHQYSLLPD